MSVPRKYFDKAQDCYVIPDGACPSPFTGDDGSAKQCVERGNCGCDEWYRYIDNINGAFK